MKVAVVGLGLIGGSMAKTIKKNTNHTVFGYDISQNVTEKALAAKAIDNVAESFSGLDVIIISLYPDDTVDFMAKHIEDFSENTLVIDCCGIKQAVCDRAEEIFFNRTSVFLGGHPMAGREFSGFDYSQETLFSKASMILTPISTTPDWAVEKGQKLFDELGFPSITITTPQHHDQVIAYTSQLAHIVSSAYMQSPTAGEFSGFSAGSFADLTRVAKLNPDMWTELFLKNSNALVVEIDNIIGTLGKFKECLKTKNQQDLHDLLQHGSDIKERLNEERIGKK